MRSTLLLLTLTVTPCFALDDPRLGGPRTYTTPSPNEQFLWVMIAPRPASDNPYLKPEQKPHEVEIYERYRATGSGMYRNDGSTTPLFTVDWYSYRVHPADDGRHFVRYHGDFALTERFPAGVRLANDEVQKQADAPALSIHDGPRALKTYTVRELVKTIDALPHSLQHILWSAGGIMTSDGREFTLMTQDARQVFFDLQTGEIARERAAGLGNARVDVVRLSLGLTGLAGFVILIGFLWHGRIGRKNAVPSSTFQVPS
jgi:hypothetical protein